MSKPGSLPESPEGVRTVRPLSDYLLLKPLAKPGMVGALYLPDCDSLDVKNGALCEVLASVGPPPRQPSGDLIPMEVKVGDKVHLAAYGTTAAGAKIKINGEDRILIRARDINGIVEEAA
jgi:chaperonin GroES